MNEVVQNAEPIALNEVAEANQAYGALTEGLYQAGFNFERAMARALSLIKGDLWMKVGNGFVDINEFVRSLQLDRFKVLADQRKEFADRVQELQPKVSTSAIADAFGVTEGAIRKVRKKSEGGGGKGKRNGKGGSEKVRGAGDGKRDAARIHQRDTREERREEKLKSMGEAAVLSGRYSVLYADAPWEDEFGPNNRQTELHYPVMGLEAIKALPVAKISADDAVLYLWALPHMIPSALEVMAAWGFEYRTEIIWGKNKMGLGEWARQQHETMLIGRRGAFPPPPTAVRSPSLVMAARGKHSAKPSVFAEMIESWYPTVPKIELFRRGAARRGWSSWGNEAKPAEAAE